MPASQRLVRVIAEIEDNPLRQLTLRNALVGDREALVIIDCLPPYGELPVMALAVATHHLFPLKPAALDLQATRSSLRRVDAIRTLINPGLMLAGFVHTVFDVRTSVAVTTETLLLNTYPDLPIIRIPSAVVVGMAPGAHQLLEDYASLSPATYCPPDGSHQDRASRMSKELELDELFGGRSKMGRMQELSGSSKSGTNMPIPAEEVTVEAFSKEPFRRTGDQPSR